jgi:hypothetical protein
MTVGTDPPKGWWQAKDGKWYPPELHPSHRPAQQTSAPGAPFPGWWQASDGKWYPPDLHPSNRVPRSGNPTQDLTPSRPQQAVRSRPWYRRKRWWALGAALFVLVVIAATSSSNPASNNTSGNATPTTSAGTAPKGHSTGAVASTPTSSSPPAAAAGPKTSFADGTWVVNQQIAPGTYIAPGGSNCYWERDSDLTGSANSTLANSNNDGQQIVTIASTDAGFQTQGCGTWQPLPRSMPLLSSFGDGTYAIGVDIATGTYSAPGGSNCYWEQDSDFSGSANSTLANDNPTGPVTVQMASGAVAFIVQGCGTWTRD